MSDTRFHNWRYKSLLLDLTKYLSSWSCFKIFTLNKCEVVLFVSLFVFAFVSNNRTSKANGLRFISYSVFFFSSNILICPMFSRGVRVLSLSVFTLLLDSLCLFNLYPCLFTLFTSTLNFLSVLTFFICNPPWNLSPFSYDPPEPPNHFCFLCPCLVSQEGISKACWDGGWLVDSHEFLFVFRSSFSVQLVNHTEGIKLNYSHLLSQKSKQLFEISRHWHV